MHPTTQRLFEALQVVAGLSGWNEPGRAAAHLGESQATVTNWRSRGVSQGGMLKAAGLLGVNPGWLATGQGGMFAPSIQADDAKASSPELIALDPREGVPLISWVQAGCWSDVHDPYEVGDAEDWLPCPVRHGPRSYCLRVRGDSMNNPDGRPSYADGDIIFVDPDKEAKNGDRVIVRMDDQAEVTFKQLLLEDGRKILKALNPGWLPRYIEINGNATMAGVVIGKWVPE